MPKENQIFFRLSGFFLISVLYPYLAIQRLVR